MCFGPDLFLYTQQAAEKPFVQLQSFGGILKYTRFMLLISNYQFL